MLSYLDNTRSRENNGVMSAIRQWNTGVIVNIKHHLDIVEVNQRSWFAIRGQPKFFWEVYTSFGPPELGLYVSEYTCLKVDLNR